MEPAVKKHIITIAGRPGSGKSTTAKLLAAELGYDHFSSGDLFRALASERGTSLLDANHAAEKDTELDTLVDARLQEIGRTEDRQIIDSRTAWHWMPQSFKVYLDLDLTIAAQRILDQMDAERLANEHVHDDIDAYAANLQQRLASESRRYKALYGIDPYVADNYDLVIDTARLGIKETVDAILAAFETWSDTTTPLRLYTSLQG